MLGSRGGRHRASPESDAGAWRLVSPMVLLAAAFALGIAIALRVAGVDGGDLRPLLHGLTIAAGFAMLLTGAAVVCGGLTVVRAGLLTLAVCAGGVRAVTFEQAWRVRSAGLPDPAAPRLVRVRGIVQGTPRLHVPSGPLARFDHRDVVTSFVLDVTRWSGRRERTPAEGLRVRVIVVGRMATVPAGAVIETTGMLRGPDPPDDDDAIDARRLARRRGEAATLRVASGAAIRFVARAPEASGWRRWRATIRARATQWLLADLPARAGEGGRTRDRERAALLVATLLGAADPWATDLRDAFRRVGLAHLLAISGLHLGIAVGLAAVFLRWSGHPRRWHAIAIIVLVLGFLMLVETRPPVVRAGVMAIALHVGLALRRRWRLDGLVAVAGIGLLVANPARIEDAGFQLSFAVVLALITFGRSLHDRWFPEIAIARRLLAIDRGPRRSWSAFTLALRDGLSRAVTTAVLAWIVATPITVTHFGTVTVLAVPLSVLGVPWIAAVLAIGYAKIAATALVPPVGVVLAPLLAALADGLVGLVRVGDGSAFSALDLPAVPGWWGPAAFVLVVLWFAGGTARAPRLGRAAAVILAAVAFTPADAPGPAALRVETLAVGNGTCHLVRTGAGALLVDAGSRSHPAVGRRRVVPALRSRGVRRLERMVITHADLDHFSAVIDVLGAVDVGAILITPQYRARVRDRPDGPEAMILRAARAARTPVLDFAGGDALALGPTTLACMHPPRGARFDDDNDASMALLFRHQARRILLTGDLERRGLGALDTVLPPGPIDVIELPHHGAAEPAARAFVARREPEIVVQSTADATRAAWWADLAARHLVTARDGTITVTVDGRGRIEADAARAR